MRRRLRLGEEKRRTRTWANAQRDGRPFECRCLAYHVAKRGRASRYHVTRSRPLCNTWHNQFVYQIWYTYPLRNSRVQFKSGILIYYKILCHKNITTNVLTATISTRTSIDARTAVTRCPWVITAVAGASGDSADSAVRARNNICSEKHSYHISAEALAMRLLWPPSSYGFFFFLFFLTYSQRSQIGCLPYTWVENGGLLWPIFGDGSWVPI